MKGVLMNYFQILSIIFGSAMILGGLWFVLAAGWWKEVITKIYPEKRPVWINLSSLAFLALVGWTWAELIAHQSVYAFVVTFVVSLSLVKILLLSFFYRKYREIVFGMLAEPVALRVVMLSTVAVGAALLTLGLLF